MGAAQVPETVEHLLARGDTTAAIAHLERDWRTNPTCQLPTLLTRRATPASADWRARARAQELFEKILSTTPTAACWYEYALLKEKQGVLSTARRMLDRAARLLDSQPEQDTPEFRGELLYRRAAIMDEWLRNFDHLVQPPALAVSSPGCLYHGYFCENFAAPEQFNERLDASGDLSGVVANERHATAKLLDASLALNPRHLGARRLRLRRALIEGDWLRFAEIARDGETADRGALLPRLATLAAFVHEGAYEPAARVLQGIDSLIPDSLRAEFERLEAIVVGTAPARAEGLWTLSDPLFLTEDNERRIQHYARIALADIGFADERNRVRGRDTEPGRLVLRYGWPRRIWDVRRDGRLEVDPEQMRAAFDVLACGMGGPSCEMSALVGARHASPESHGRWTFLNYGPHLPNFILERNLSSSAYHYKQMTFTQQFDSALARILPSSFDSPYEQGMLTGLVTQFPRPSGPVIEVGARFDWDSASTVRGDSVQLGIFVHERYDGRLVNRGVRTVGTASSGRFGGILPVIPGPLQVAMEGWIPGRGIAGQLRVNVTIPVVRDSLALSDILVARAHRALGDIERREEAPLRPLAEARAAPDDTLAFYWETYGLTADTTGAVEYDVSLTIEEEGAGNLATSFLRVASEVLGVRRSVDEAIIWMRRRRAGSDYLADAVEISLPNRSGTYAVTIRVHDRLSGGTAETVRMIEIR